MHDQVTRFIMGKVARQITEMESRENLDSPITTQSYPATTKNMSNRREGTNELPMYRDIPNILSQPPNNSNQHAVTEVPNFRGPGSQQTIAGYTRTHTDNRHMTYEQNSTNNLMHTSRNQGSQGPNVQSNSQRMQSTMFSSQQSTGPPPQRQSMQPPQLQGSYHQGHVSPSQLDRQIPKKGTSRQRSGKGAIRKRFPLQKPRREKTKPTTRHLYHETYRKPNEQLFSQ